MCQHFWVQIITINVAPRDLPFTCTFVNSILLPNSEQICCPWNLSICWFGKSLTGQKLQFFLCRWSLESLGVACVQCFLLRNGENRWRRRWVVLNVDRVRFTRTVTWCLVRNYSTVLHKSGHSLGLLCTLVQCLCMLTSCCDVLEDFIQAAQVQIVIFWTLLHWHEHAWTGKEHLIQCIACMFSVDEKNIVDIEKL